MPERPIYFTKPDQEEKPDLSIKSVGCVTLTAGTMFGGVAGVGSGLVWGSEVGLRVGIETGVGLGGFMGGMMAGVTSSERAKQFAEEGRTRRAYLEALRASVESAIGVGIGMGMAGYGIADIPGAIGAGAFGMFIGGGGLGQLAFRSISETLRSRQISQP